MQGDPVLGIGVTLQAENITVAGGGQISARGQGFPGGMGPGKGAYGTGPDNPAGGAGYGGIGEAGESGLSGGNGYGDTFMPIALGSGGGNNVDAIGGAGGGAIKIVAGSLTVNGYIDVSGGYGETSLAGEASGGGSGGSIWIVSDSFTGSGYIFADGGVGAYSSTSSMLAGGGAGGRVVIDVPEQRILF